jgi:ABC-type nitrate/sulfonate/bicarbonate transport system permease component
MNAWAGRLRTPAAFVVVLGIWQLVYLMGLVPAKYFPSIGRIGHAFLDMVGSGELIHGEGLTFSRAAIGLLGASLIGIVLAVLSDFSPTFGRGARLISSLLQPLPPAAFVPMAVFSLGLGWKLYAFVIILVTVWPPFLNGAAGLTQSRPCRSTRA